MRLFKYALSCLTIFSLSALAVADGVVIPENKEDFHIFLLMGQSNMVGRRSYEGEMDQTPHPRIVKMDILGNWREGIEPISVDWKKAVGPGMSFARKLVEENPDITVGLINVAVGGTPIAEWSRGSKWYNRAVNFARIAQNTGVIKGVLWHQGEHDMWNDWLYPNRVSNYQSNLEQLIDDFRKELMDPYLPWIVGGYTQDVKSHTYGYQQVWNQTKAVGSTFFRTGYVSSNEVPFSSADPIHFSAEGQREMGRRYASEYLKLNGFNEEKPYVGHWTWKGKEWLDSEAVVDDDGWKFHPELGVYWDARFPFIKHAQLGWMEISLDEDRNIRLDSPFIGKDPETVGRTVRSEGRYLVLKNENEIEGDTAGYDNAMYIYPEDLSDPEAPVYGDLIWVNLEAEAGDELTFYRHDIEEYVTELPNMPLVLETSDYNGLTEGLFIKMQEAHQLLINTTEAEDGKWSFMRTYVDDVQYFRDYVNIFGWEAFYYASENELGDTRLAWREHFHDLLYWIDDYVRESQSIFQDSTDTLLEAFHSQ